MESTAAPAGGALALSPAAVGGRRRKLKLVTKKKARKVLKKLGLRMPRGGAETDAVPLPAETVEAAKVGGADEMPEVPAAAATAGRRHRRGGKKTKRRSASRRSASIFGL